VLYSPDSVYLPSLALPCFDQLPSMDCPIPPPFHAPGMATGPPGEDSVRAVRISTPVSVTSNVCSTNRVSRQDRAWVGCTRTELGSELPIDGGSGPVVWPRHISILAQSNHRFYCESHARFRLAGRLALGIVGNARGAMEEPVDAVAAICSYCAASLGFCIFLDNVAEFSQQNTRLDGLDSKIEALSRRLHHPDGIRIRLCLVSNVVCFVEVPVEALVVKGNVDVEDIAIHEHTLIGNAVADDFVGRRTYRLWEVVVIEG